MTQTIKDIGHLAKLVQSVMEDMPSDKRPSLTLEKRDDDYCLTGDGRMIRIQLFPGHLQFVRQGVELDDLHFYEAHADAHPVMSYMYDPENKTVTFKTLNSAEFAADTLKALLAGESDSECSKREYSGRDGYQKIDDMFK